MCRPARALYRCIKHSRQKIDGARFIHLLVLAGRCLCRRPAAPPSTYSSLSLLDREHDVGQSWNVCTLFRRKKGGGPERVDLYKIANGMAHERTNEQCVSMYRRRLMTIWAGSLDRACVQLFFDKTFFLLETTRPAGRLARCDRDAAGSRKY